MGVFTGESTPAVESEELGNRPLALAQAMANSLNAVKAAILPALSREEVEARSLRPGKRGEMRKRSGPEAAVS